MKNELFAIKDVVSNAFGQPFIVGKSPQNALAIRTFEAMMKTNPYYPDHADDFHLYRIGTYEDTTAEVDRNIEFVISASQFTVGKEQ